jgi:cytochrome d ubiquinol oxidase subunit I
MIAGQAHPTDWWAVIFNPSFPYRLAHVLLASGLTAAFLVAGLSAFRWLRGEREPDVAAALRTGVLLAATLIPVQVFVGDLHGLNTFEHQPAKVAAMEGVWQDERGAPMLLFALPNEAERRNDYAIGIPRLASLILTHELDGEIRGLDSFKGEHPPVAPVFWSFRVMVGVGMLMLAVSWLAAWQLRRGGTPAPWLQKVLVGMTFSGWVATLAGWYVTEIGRQPWLVTGVLRTADAASATPAPIIGISLSAYLAIYLVLLLSYVSVLFHLARKGGATVAAPITAPRGEPDET